jgi:hypothetical protein
MAVFLAARPLFLLHPPLIVILNRFAWEKGRKAVKDLHPFNLKQFYLIPDNKEVYALNLTLFQINQTKLY